MALVTGERMGQPRASSGVEPNETDASQGRPGGDWPATNAPGKTSRTVNPYPTRRRLPRQAHRRKSFQPYLLNAKEAYVACRHQRHWHTRNLPVIHNKRRAHKARAQQHADIPIWITWPAPAPGQDRRRVGGSARVASG